jgi:hypothetical protein
MTYSYDDLKHTVFTESGQIKFLQIRDRAKHLITMSGAASCEKIIIGINGDTWEMLACIDRLVEIGDIMEVPNPHSRAGQHRIFIGKY